jgi:hypothetical protein
MANTYEIISKTILTADQASVSFTGLGAYSSDYTDLLVRLSIRSDAASTVDWGKTLISCAGSSSTV